VCNISAIVLGCLSIQGADADDWQRILLADVTDGARLLHPLPHPLPISPTASRVVRRLGLVSPFQFEVWSLWFEVAKGTLGRSDYVSVFSPVPQPALQ
jgi:hypothetical protein